MLPKNELRESEVRQASGQVEGTHNLDVLLEEGTSICFTPTGEQLRITAIGADHITFEKLP